MNAAKSDREPRTLGVSLEAIQNLFQPLLEYLPARPDFFRREPVTRPQTISDRIAKDLSVRTGLRNFELALGRVGVDQEELELLWKAVAPLMEEVNFDAAANQLYSEALGAASCFGRVRSFENTGWNAREAMELQASLDFYHYIVPRLLLVVATARCLSGSEASTAENIPASHAAPVEEAFARLRRVLLPGGRKNVKRLERLWAQYEDSTRDSRRPLSERAGFRRAAASLFDQANQLAQTLKNVLPPEAQKKVLGWASRLQRIEPVLPALLMNVTILNFHFRPAGTMTCPAPVMRSPAKPVAAPRRQTVRPRRLEAPSAELVPA